MCTTILDDNVTSTAHTRLVFTSPQWPQALSTNRNQLTLWHGYVITTMVQCSALITWSVFSKTFTTDTQYLAREGEIWGFFCECKPWLVFCLGLCNDGSKALSCFIAPSYNGTDSIRWDVFTHPYHEFKTEIMEWMSNYIPHKTMHVITSTCPNFS